VLPALVCGSGGSCSGRTVCTAAPGLRPAAHAHAPV